MSEERQETRKSSLRTAGFGALVGLVTAGVINALYVTPGIGDVFKKWELALLDNRLVMSGRPDRVTEDLVVVTIDDRAIRKLEIDQQISWPFPRWFYGELVAALEKLEPAAIVFDFVFADQRDGVRYGTDGNPFAEASSADAATLVEYSRGTGQQMNHAGNVVHGFFAMSLDNEELVNEDGTKKDPAARDLEIKNLSGWNQHLTGYFDARIAGSKGNAQIPKFREKESGQVQVLRYPEANLLVGARALGLVNHEHVTDIDGNSRVFLPLVNVGGRPAADLATTAILVSQIPKTEAPAWTEAQPPAPSTWAPLPPIEYDRNQITIGKWRVPVDKDGLAFIRWRGNWEHHAPLVRRTRNVLDIWYERDNLLLDQPTTRIQKEDIKGKIVLIGFTGQGEGADFVNSPFGNQPGVFRHAAIIDTVLTQDFPRGIPDALDWFLAFALAGATGALILARAQKATRVSQMGTGFQVVRLLAIGFVPVVAFAAAAYAAFLLGGTGDYDAHIVRIVPALVGTLLTIPQVVVVGIAWSQADERRARKIAVRALGPALVKQVLSGGGELKMGGTKVPLTLFFSDIAGFTTISEKLSPEELINMLNEYLTRVSEILHDGHGATIDKYIGDAVMAFWGAPLPQPEAPVQACMAAIDVMAAIDQFSAELVAQGLSPLRTRIGLNTGFAVAGGVGHIRDLDDGKFTYTAMGDTVNLASRLEGANKAYGTTCMIGPETYEQAKHAILARELDLVRVKGKTIPVRVFELMGRASDALPEKRKIKERYEAALVRFRNREFEAARADFLALHEEHKDPPSKSLAATCDEMIKNPPPPTWDGSNELHEK